MKLETKNVFLLIIVFTVLFGAIAMIGLNTLTKFTGQSYKGTLPPQTPEEVLLQNELQHHIEVLAGEIGERNFKHYDRLNAAADYIEQSFLQTGLSVKRQAYNIKNTVYYNIEAEKKGIHQPDTIIIVGAHYDSVHGSPGANDNGSGVAGILSLARMFSSKNPSRTIRLVAFANEEPPFFLTQQMGSYVYARECKEQNENIVAMLSLETIGYYSDKEKSQRHLPLLGFFYPSKGNFIGFVSNLSSRTLLRNVVASFRRNKQFPSEGGAFPGFFYAIYWSDHWSFWKMGYPALMVTDTAFLRYPYYHTSLDTPDKIDFEGLSRVVFGLAKVLDDLSGVERME
jgi:Zn-dependent M28 family amino/carboxypeptidase